MGGSVSKEQPDLHQLLPEPWRDLDWGKRNEMKEKVRTFQIRAPDVKRLRILIHGPVEAGKSTFINSIDNVFQERMTIRAFAEACAGHTKMYRSHKIKDGRYENHLPFVMCDVMGLEKGDSAGMQTEDLISILEGHIKDDYVYRSHKIKDGRYENHLPFVMCDVMGLEKGDSAGMQTEDLISILEGHIKDDYVFNPTSACSDKDKGYNKDPDLKHKIHCLVSVIPADSLLWCADKKRAPDYSSREADEEFINKFRVVRERANMLGIPQVVILSKVDEACPYVKRDVKMVYRSRVIQNKIKHCSNNEGVPQNCIFPVKNYHQEIYLNNDMDVLLLSALTHILHFASNFVDEQKRNEGLKSEKGQLTQLSARKKPNLDGHCLYLSSRNRGHNFREESSIAAAASTSISQSSYAAGPLSVDIPQEHYHNDDHQHSCSYCTEVPDSGHWAPVKPEVSSENRISTYSLSSPAGSYECSVSRLRWLCAGPVSLQYRFTDWHVYAEQLAQMQIRPAGPLMDIKLISGDLEEIHLPHFLCLGASGSSVCDAVKVLHGHGNGVRVKECKVTRRHAKVLNPSFSLFGLVYYVKRFFFSPQIHCELLLFCTHTSPLNLHVYVVPDDTAHIMKIYEKQNPSGMQIDKPGAVGPLPLQAKIRVTTSCQSEIQPQEIILQRVSTSNYFEIYMRQPEETFGMEVFSSEDREPIWRVQIRRQDYQQHSRMPRQIGCQTAAGFLKDHMSVLISKVTEVLPIADRLRTEKVISQESYSTIRAAPTSQERVRLLYDYLQTAQGKMAFYTILVEKERLLVEELWTK